jgi:hypothetical protein
MLQGHEEDDADEGYVGKVEVSQGRLEPAEVVATAAGLVGDHLGFQGSGSRERSGENQIELDRRVEHDEAVHISTTPASGRTRVEQE